MTASQASTIHPLPRILFFGMPGIFSRTVLAGLLAAHLPVSALILPTSATVTPTLARLDPPRLPPPAPNDLPLLNPDIAQSTIQLAWRQAIPVYEVGQLSAPEVQNLLREFAPTVACVACFSKRIPPALLAIPPHGFLNLHPSLLPAYRGPAPLFWQLRNGEPHIGATVHWMDEKLDTGDIAAQTRLHLPDGITGPKADELCAKAGSELLVDVLKTLATGQAPRTVQADKGSYQSWPQAKDFTLSTSWSARHAYNFMRGTAEWGQPYAVDVAGKQLWLANALTYRREDLGHPYVQENDMVQIQFSPGVLQAQLVE